MSRMRCMNRLTTVIPTQQQNPITIGLPPVLINLTIFVLIPMADMARIMKNLLSSLIGVKKEAGTPKEVVMVVMMEANTK